eukprot:CAMPEP_0202698670 /NCGR_PEP_ID=MMETSP1385-20130828/11916_1 /ASSEMBLY_ACC=CAM_ASM_000861 /TAXON_ID=933848 /ORGANISM="Elphidium margaritaceum" /LENGTH=573 /DNA_ID=CAMNT_0049355433 /DNA_START=98 /DNA_END=1819 /DNA_ORIENTATION=-
MKYSHAPGDPPSISPPSLTPSSSSSNAGTAAAGNTQVSKLSKSSRTNVSHSHNHTPSSTTSSSVSHSRTPRRRDLFDEHLDETYRNTLPSSSIAAPTLDQGILEKNWRSKAEAALASFQRDKQSHSQSQLTTQQSNPIMQLLLEHATLVEDENEYVRLQECVLQLVYASSSQYKQLSQPKNKRFRQRYNNHHNNNEHRLHRFDISWYEKLPGPQPHSITRQNLQRLRSYYYWVAEKSDGIRFMLLLSNNHPLFEAYVVGRKFEFYRLQHAFYKCFLNEVTGPSLLDGELSLNAQQNKLEYIAFDCVAMGGRSCSNECLSTRIEFVKNFIRKYERKLIEYPKIQREKYRNANTPDKVVVDPPLLLTAKRHFKASDIGVLLSQIRRDEHGEYWFDNGRRKTKNDGLIFTPQENNFLMSYDPGALVKWKFLEKNTIDLKLKAPFIFRGGLDLYAGGKGQSDVLFATIDMRQSQNRTQFETLLEEMQRLSSNRHQFVASFIVECAWDFDTNEWQLVQNRPDKHIPNFITVCTDTLRVMMDNVTEKELIEACAASDETHDSYSQSAAGAGAVATNSYH